MARYRLVRPWTREDDEALMALLRKEHVTVAGIAVKLRRSIPAVRIRATYLGLPISQRDKKTPKSP